jgi:hypothetical protein
MRNPSITTAYKTYFDNVLSKNHNNPELIARWGADPSRFETQVMCRKMGTPVPDTNKYEHEGEVFGPHRWPYDPMGEPHYTDPPIEYVIGSRMRCIGTTWWDWKNRKSVGLGFDFDSIKGHAMGVGTTKDQIAKLDKIDVPWIEVIRSTRGEGRHLYIWFQDPYPETMNHDEHAALARSFLPLIAQSTGLEIEANMGLDSRGSVLWIHHVNATQENQGYAQIKPATQLLTADLVPPNWKDYVEVVSGGRTKVRVQGWAPDGTKTDGDELDEMTQAYARIPLDEGHMKILEELAETGHSSLWVHDHYLWQGHTAGLKQVFDYFKEKGTPLRGLFDTNSLDSDPGKPNCFMRPKLNGAWDVYRFGEGVVEHDIWDTQGKWTHTTFNYPSTLKQICLACGGWEGTEEKQGYIFGSVEDVMKALALLGSKMTLPARAIGRSISMYTSAKGKTVLVIEKSRGDVQAEFPKYVKTPRGWERVIFDAIETPDKEIEEEKLWSELDNMVRALRSEKGFDSWVLMDHEDWTEHPRENVKSFLSHLGFPKTDLIIGKAVYKPWTLVNKPFQPDYPGGRMWNRNAAQIVYEPIELSEGEAPHHPHWDKLLNHLGTNLDEYIPGLQWCKDWGIKTGGDYLTAWIACMFKNPYGRLPYLFMYGPQKSGKSSFFEAIDLLVTTGVERADRALTSQAGYNGELDSCILAVIDEVDIARAGPSVYNKIKDWTTGRKISIHEKYRTPRRVVNTTHWVQMANSRSSCPVLPGDTRITAMFVDRPDMEIPWDIFEAALKQEAAHFMRTIADYEMQPAISRLMIEPIETQTKADIAAGNMTDVDQFVEECCYQIAGQAVKFSAFKEKFLESLEEYQRGEWPDRLIRQALSERFPVGRGAKINQIIIGNISFNPDAQAGIPFTKVNDRVERGEI